jgi:hypothetical protein
MTTRLYCIVEEIVECKYDCVGKTDFLLLLLCCVVMVIFLNKYFEVVVLFFYRSLAARSQKNNNKKRTVLPQIMMGFHHVIMERGENVPEK